MYTQLFSSTTFNDENNVIIILQSYSKKSIMKIICSVALFTMFIRCVILVARFATANAVGLYCAEKFKTLNDTAVYNSWVVVGYYLVLEIMRFFEYVAFGYNIYTYWSKDDFKLGALLKVKITNMVCLVIVFCLLPIPFATAVVISQIMMEDTLEHHESQRHNVCSLYIKVSKMYYAYCALNVGRYVIALSIRHLMVITTIQICEEWDDSRNTIQTGSREINLNDVEPTQVANEIHRLLSDNYDKYGKKVEALSNPFRPWFIIPWIAYVFETSINAKSVLSPWEEGANMSFSIWVKMYTLLYSVTQFCMLLIQYLCALKINGSHQEYCREVRKL